MSLRAVFFDMGGTIDTYRWTPEFRAANVCVIRDRLARSGINPEMDDAQLAAEITRGMAAYFEWNRKSNIELNSSEIWSKFILNGDRITSEKIAAISEELAFLYETRLYVREMRAEIPQTLEKIKKLGLKIGIISNTQSISQVAFNLEEYGIREFFNPIVLSSSFGRRKPDPAIFYHAARLANLPTGSCAFVGDMINKDILGAQRSGFRLAVQIIHDNNNEELQPLSARPDAVIRNMTELLPILDAELNKDRMSEINPKPKTVKAIFFDAGDVLYHRPQKNKHLDHFLNEIGIKIPANVDAEKVRLTNLAFSGKIGRYDYYEKMLRLYGVTEMQAIAQGINAMRLDDSTVEILEGVPETILRLKKKGFLLGIITDTALPISKKLKWFDRFGFGHVWDLIISSKEVGVRKPAPVLYESAIAQTGVRPDEAVFVGHKATELSGAKAVGMKTIAFNYEKDASADIYIDHFSDLLKVPLLDI